MPRSANPCRAVRPKRTAVASAASALAAAGLLLSLARPAAAATPREVHEAIERAKAFLYKEQKGDNWEQVAAPEDTKRPADVKGKQWGGLSSMAVYALLAAGEKPQSAHLAPAIEWLKKAPVHGDYAVGLRSQVWTFLPERDAKLASKDDFTTLSKAVYTDGPGKGFYPYFLAGEERGPTGWFDLSVSQYGVLGMWACEQAGQEVPDKYWEMVDAAWKAAQEKDGGWPYQPSREKTKPTMTAAGIATLFITQDHLLGGRRWDTCAGGQRNEYIEKGLAYMDKHVGELLDGDFYGMYGVERIGVAGGRKYFGTTDWYAVGAEYLVRHQRADGGWDAHRNYNSLASTVFATLFLVRGRAPVMMNKLQWAGAGKQSDPWDERPRDVANCTHWAGRQLETYLNWQVVNLKVSADALHDAPILYLSGSEAPAFDEADLDKLRSFVRGGGMILGNADCGSQAFIHAFTDLAHKLFPKYELRDLPPNHPIYTNEQFHSSKWRAHPHLLGLSNGVRELMLLVPEADLSRVWQVRAEKTHEDLYQLGQDIFLYAIDKENLLDRGQTYIVRADGRFKASHEIRVARLMVGDNPDPEPGGWPRLAAVMHNQDGVRLDLGEVKLGEGKLTGGKSDGKGEEKGGFHVAHLTGTTKFNLREEQRAELRDFVHKGGTLVVDAAGGSTDFAASAERELAATFGGAAESPGAILPPESGVYQIAGAKIESVRYRPFVRGRLIGKLNVPRVRGIDVDKRTAVFYSPEDLSAGLVGQPVDGIYGYAPESATALMRNMLLHAAGIASVSPPKPQQAPESPEAPRPPRPPHRPRPKP